MLTPSLGIKRIPTLHVRTIIILVTFASIFVVNIFGFTDPDFWWHLRTGQYIFDTHTIPKIDIFSYTAAGEPWIDHQWASELLLFSLFRAFGYAGDVILSASIITLAFFLVFRLCIKLGVNDLVAVMLVFLATILTIPFIAVRPLVFTWLFFSIFLTSLYLYHRGFSRRLWHLPLLMVLWVNLHGGFAIGLVLIGLLVVARLGERLFTRKPLEIRHPLIILALSVLGALINPYGLKELTFPLSYLGSSSPTMQFVTEWQSPNFHEPYFLVMLASLLLLIALGTAHRGLGIWPFLLTVLLTSMSLRSAYYIPLYALALAPVVGETLRLRFNHPKWLERQQTSSTLGYLNWLILILLTVVAASATIGSPSSQLRRMPLLAGKFPYPVEGVNYVQANYPQARLFNEHVWGGYLIYTLFPTQRVFIDGRNDPYGQRLMNEAAEVALVRPNWEGVLDRYEVDLVFIKKDSPLSVLLTASPYWEKVFTGKIEDIFVRKGTH